jgi:hypothetical protein
MFDDILKIFKIILEMNITDNSKDDLLNFYIVKAKISIMRYCILTEEQYWFLGLTNQTAELALYFYKSKKNIGLKSKAEGTRNFTYTEDAIPASILSTLPLPQITLS